jgi:hypothetical protein
MAARGRSATPSSSRRPVRVPGRARRVSGLVAPARLVAKVPPVHAAAARALAPWRAASQPTCLVLSLARLRPGLPPGIGSWLTRPRRSMIAQRLPASRAPAPKAPQVILRARRRSGQGGVYRLAPWRADSVVTYDALQAAAARAVGSSIVAPT